MFFLTNQDDPSIGGFLLMNNEICQFTVILRLIYMQ